EPPGLLPHGRRQGPEPAHRDAEGGDGRDDARRDRRCARRPRSEARARVGPPRDEPEGRAADRGRRARRRWHRRGLGHRGSGRRSGAGWPRRARGWAMTAPLTVLGPAVEGTDRVLTPDALAFLAELARRVEPRRQEILQAPRERLAPLRACATAAV